MVIQYGDYQDAMAGVVEELTHAKEHAANDVQRDMLQAYIDHFKVTSWSPMSHDVKLNGCRLGLTVSYQHCLMATNHSRMYR